MRRAIAALGVGAPVLSVPVVLVAGLITPGYDPALRTISRLAEPGLPAASAVGLAIFSVGLALLLLASQLGPQSVPARVLLGIAGASLLLAAVVPLNPSSANASTIHRSATAVAMLALVAAPLVFAPTFRRRDAWRGYARLSFGVGITEVGMLLIGLALLPSTFAVGAWERCLLALPLAWVVLISARLLRCRKTEPMLSPATENSSWPAIVSTHEKMKAPAASASSSLSYRPVIKVITANAYMSPPASLDE
jgi:hypothetical protein